jgi:hypothetical protein
MRTLNHPGPASAQRILSVVAPRLREFHVHVPANQPLFGFLRRHLATLPCDSAMLTVYGGVFESLAYHLIEPDPTGHHITRYGAPIALNGPIRLINANMTYGHSASGEALLHCHGAFVDAKGVVQGGHLSESGTVTGCGGVSVWISAIEGSDFCARYDGETRYTLLHPTHKEAR